MSSNGSEKSSSPSENHIAIRCSGCNKRLKIPSKMAGRTINCPVCKTAVVVPILDPVDSDPVSAAPTNQVQPPLESSLIATPSDDDTIGKPAPGPLLADSLMDDDDLYKLAAEDAPPARGNHESKSVKTQSAPSITPNNGLLAEDLDDDIFKLAEETPTKKSTSAGLKIPGLALDDLDLSELDNPSPNSSAQGSTSKQSASQKSNANSSIERSVDAKGDFEFRFPCKVCGTLVNADTKQVGGKIRCPACYSEFTVPSPPAERTKRQAASPASPYSGTGKASSGNDSKQNSGRTATSRTAEELLARAAQEIETRDAKEEEDSFDFDNASWAERTFYFLKDTSAVVILISTGVFMGGVLVGADVVGQMLKSYSESGYFFGLMLVLVLAGIPILSMTLANGLALLETTANRLKQVSNWPAFSPFEAINEVALVVFACALAGVPGGLLGYIAPMLGMPPQITVGLILLSGWLLLPIVLLGMLDSQSITEPVSKPVINSIQSRSNAWKSMYISTGAILFLLFAMYLVYTIGTFVARFALGVTIPFAIFFIFHQYGLLAIQIGDVTSLPFSDPNDEEEEAEESGEATASQT